jgi:hypothetical protein
MLLPNFDRFSRISCYCITLQIPSSLDDGPIFTGTTRLQSHNTDMPVLATVVTSTESNDRCHWTKSHLITNLAVLEVQNEGRCSLPYPIDAKASLSDNACFDRRWTRSESAIRTDSMRTTRTAHISLPPYYHCSHASSSSHTSVRAITATPTF